MADSSQEDDLVTQRVSRADLARFLRGAVATYGGLPSTAATQAIPHATIHQKMGVVGTGATATVHLAHDPQLRRHVALKVLKESDAELLKARFVVEAQIIAQLEHPHIVPVYKVEWDADGQPAYAMKLIDGETLAELLARSAAARKKGSTDRSLSVDALLEHFLKLCDASYYAHTKGVVHRDIKPENIMVGPHNEVYLMDWGIAQVRGETREALEIKNTNPKETVAGAVFGTPMYMAPEQATGNTEAIGPASDQYALGLILYEILSCSLARPLHEDLHEVLEVARTGTLLPLRSLPQESIDREMKAIVARATAKEPTKRYESVAALAEDVRRYLANEPVKAAPDGMLQKLQRTISNHRAGALRLIFFLTMMVLLLVTLGTIGASIAATVQRQVAEAREARLAAFHTELAASPSQLDRAMADLEGHLMAVTASASLALTQGAPASRAILSPVDFKGALKPADTVHSTNYDRLISPTRSDIVLAPNVDQAAVQLEAAKLLQVEPIAARAHLQTRQVEGESLEQTTQRWIDEPGPIRWVAVGTETGIYFEMPGAYWVPDAFDPRTRPWYTNGEGAKRPRWANPYQEASSGTLLLPCSLQIDGPNGERLGVASISVPFYFLIAQFMDPGLEAVKETFILDSSGNMLVRSSQVLGKARHTDLHEVYEIGPYPRWEALGTKQTGGVVTLDDGTQLVAHPMSNGLIYVAEVDWNLAASL